MVNAMSYVLILLVVGGTFGKSTSKIKNEKQIKEETLWQRLMQFLWADTHHDFYDEVTGEDMERLTNDFDDVERRPSKCSDTNPRWPCDSGPRLKTTYDNGTALGDFEKHMLTLLGLKEAPKQQFPKPPLYMQHLYQQKIKHRLPFRKMQSNIYAHSALEEKGRHKGFLTFNIAEVVRKEVIVEAELALFKFKYPKCGTHQWSQTRVKLYYCYLGSVTKPFYEIPIDIHYLTRDRWYDVFNVSQTVKKAIKNGETDVTFKISIEIRTHEGLWADAPQCFYHLSLSKITGQQPLMVVYHLEPSCLDRLVPPSPVNPPIGDIDTYQSDSLAQGVTSLDNSRSGEISKNTQSHTHEISKSNDKRHRRSLVDDAHSDKRHRRSLVDDAHNDKRHRRSLVDDASLASLHPDWLKNSISFGDECKRHKWQFDFDKLGWSWWIYPRRYIVNFCKGWCHRHPPTRLTGHISSNHAFLVNMYHAEPDKISRIPIEPSKTSCVPETYSSMDILYVDQDGNTRQVIVDRLIVETCGCR